ncbi:MAG: non-hydrolyzing UDP-N-acetylglucosamine 2-epimerase [Planctomycetota bacterium]
MKIHCVCGARPNFMKIAAVIRAMRPHAELRPTIVHTGQHYDERLCRILFEDLELPRPDIDLEVGSASHARQTAEIMRRFEPVLLDHRPDLVVVVGDVNSTVACALVAVKLGVPVAHVEAGLRSFDRTMPEEINRLMTDALSDLLFVSEPSGAGNLQREGVPDEHVIFCGNVMIDTLLCHRERAASSKILESLALRPREYAALTLHRPSNVDRPDTLEGLLAAVEELQAELPVVLPAHPRTIGRLHEFGLMERARALPRLRLLEPLGYLDFLKLMSEARLVLTDSGGIQEETTILNVPCLTLRENTERPVTIEAGLNELVGADPQRIRAGCRRILDSSPARAPRPEKWDGRAGERIVETLLHCREKGIPRR